MNLLYRQRSEMDSSDDRDPLVNLDDWTPTLPPLYELFQFSVDLLF